MANKNYKVEYKLTVYVTAKNEGDALDKADLIKSKSIEEPTISEAGEGFYDCVAVSKDDIREVFKGNKKALAKINKMTDDDMQYLARKFGESFTGGTYWQDLKIVFESRFLND